MNWPNEIIFWSTEATSVILSYLRSQVFLDLSKFDAFIRGSCSKADLFGSATANKLGAFTVFAKSATFFYGLSGDSKSLICLLRGLDFIGASPKDLSMYSSLVDDF